MSTTSKSPRSVLVTAHRVARSSLPEYSHVNSPKTFTQHQIFACLALKSAMALDYRGIAALLGDCPELRSAIRMVRAPHWTTLQKAADRLLSSTATAALLDATVAPRMLSQTRSRRPRRRVAIAAVDSTGFESRHASRYFVQRKEGHSKQVQDVTYGRFPKLALACDSTSHLILSAVAGGGPKPDIDQFRRVLGPALKRARIHHVVADAGYDSEANHEFARDLHRVISHIPAKHGRPSRHPPKGRYRRLMKLNFDVSRYGQRSQAETVVSMIKRRQGQATRGRSFHARCRDLRLMTLAHNIMILWRRRRFSTEPV